MTEGRMTLDTLIDLLQEDRKKVGGDKEVVIRITRHVHPNSSYTPVPNPSYATDSKGYQIHLGARRSS